MAIIIDGYNLMHVTRFSVGPNDQRRFDEARNEMLVFLDERLRRLGESDVAIVFDSDRQTTSPAKYTFGGLHVYFARDYPTADDLIEELIQSHDAPTKLLVVSSDHRLHIAAQRKRCAVMDSDEWFDQMLARYAAMMAEPETSPSGQMETVVDDEPETFENPFPEGYAEDL